VRVAIATAVLAVLAAVIALVLAGGGDDEDSTRGPASSTSSTTIVEPLTLEENIEETAGLWALFFAAAADHAACRYMTQGACEQMRCKGISGR
jgi:hypothetical protein